MPTITNALADHAARNYGIVSSGELTALGIGPHRRRALVRAGMLIPVFRQVYRLRTSPETFEGRCLAIRLAAPGAAITGRAGGRLWGVRRMGRIEQIEVRVPHYCQDLDQPWVRLRRCNIMEETDIVERPDRIRVVSPARLGFDLAADLSLLDLESVLEQLVNERLCSTEQLVEMDARLYHPRRPGSREFRAVLNSRSPGGAADSHPEVRLLDALRRRDVRGLVKQHALELPTGWTIHGDIAIPHLRWIIAIDHISWHGPRVASERDKQNDRLAQQLGWTVSRVSDHDIDQRLQQTIDELVAIYHHLLAAA